MFSFLKASPPAPRIESSRTDAEYKKWGSVITGLRF